MMTNSIIKPDYTFLEIGWGDGGTNMTNYLQYEKGWGGVGVDAKEDPKGQDRFTDKFKHVVSKVYPHNAQEFIKEVPYNCDFFSLDIDSFDYAVAHELFLNGGFRPKTVCVEFTDSPSRRCCKFSTIQYALKIIRKEINPTAVVYRSEIIPNILTTHRSHPMVLIKPYNPRTSSQYLENLSHWQMQTYSIQMTVQ